MSEMKKIGIDISLTGAEKIPVAEKNFTAMGIAADRAALSAVEIAAKLQQLANVTAMWGMRNQISTAYANALATALNAEGSRAQMTAAQIEQLNAALAIMAGTSQAAAASTEGLNASLAVSKNAMMMTEAQTRALGLAQLEAIKWNAQMASGLRRTSGELVNHAEKTNLAERMIMRMVLAYAAYKAITGTVEIVKQSAQYEMLGIAMHQVGMNAGYSASQMDGFAKAMTGPMGISMIGARKVLSQMAAAHLDLTKAQQLSTMAQNVGKVANINSTEAFERMIQAVVSGQPKMLRTMNVLVSFSQAYRDFAKNNNIVGRELSEAEKIQARFNVTLAYGANYANVYNEAFKTAGSQMLSAQRYAENARVAIGTVFLPEISVAVRAYAASLRFMSEHAGLAAAAIATLGTAVIGLGGAWVIAKIGAMGFTAAMVMNPVTLGIVAVSAAVGVLIYQLDKAKRARDELNTGLAATTDVQLENTRSSVQAARDSLTARMRGSLAGTGPQRSFTADNKELGGYTDLLSQIALEQGNRARAKAQAKQLQDDAQAEAAAEAARAAAAAAAKQRIKDQRALNLGVENLDLEADKNIAKLKEQAKAEDALAQARREGADAVDRIKIANAGQLAASAYQTQIDELAKKAATDGLALSREQSALLKSRIPEIRAAAEAQERKTLADERSAEAMKAQAKAQKDYDDAVGDPIAKLVAEGDALDRMTLARKQGKDATDAERIALAGEAAARKILNDAMEKGLGLKWAMIYAGAGGVQAAENEGKKIANEKIAAAAAETKKITDRLWRGVQEGLASAIENGFKKGLRSAQDFFDAMKGMLESVFSQWAAAKLTEKLKATVAGTALSAIPAGAMGTGDKTATAGGGLGGLWGMVTAHPYIAAAVAVTAFATSIFAAKDAALEYANRMMEAARAAKKSAEEWLHPLGEKDKMQADYMTAVTNTIMAFVNGVGDAYVTMMGYVRGTSPSTGTAKPKDPALAAALKVLADEFARRVEQMTRYQNEDYTVRRMRAQGDTAGADRLAFDQAQARERQALIDSFGPFIDAMEQATLDNLNLTLAAEAAAYALNSLSTSALNAVSGYKYQAAIFAGANPRGAPPDTAIPFTGRRMNSTASEASGYTVGGDTNVTLVLSDGTVIGRTVLKDFGRRKRLGDADLQALLS